jgi:hypothetical protein
MKVYCYVPRTYHWACPEVYKSNPHLHILLLQDPFYIICPLCLGLPVVCSLKAFELFYIHLSSLKYVTYPAHLIYLDLIITVICGKEYILQGFSLWSLHRSPVTSSLEPSWHPVLKHSQSVFFP